MRGSDGDTVAIAVSADLASGQPTVTFTILDASPDDEAVVSVVGSFNDWQPGQHTLTVQDDGRLTVAVKVSGEDDLHFRYLRTGGVWFDDNDADEITADGGVIRAGRLQAGRAASGHPAGAPSVEASSASPTADRPQEPAEAGRAAKRRRAVG